VQNVQDCGKTSSVVSKVDLLFKNVTVIKRQNPGEVRDESCEEKKWDVDSNLYLKTKRKGDITSPFLPILFFLKFFVQFFHLHINFD
jgi:hypothetical protein